MERSEQEYLVQKIRTQYTEKQHTELDALKALDRSVRRPAIVLGYALGTLAALILGSGMSLIMTDVGQTLGIAEPMCPGVVLGSVGLLLAAVNYPLYKWFLSRRRRSYAGEIIALSDQALRG